MAGLNANADGAEVSASYENAELVAEFDGVKTVEQWRALAAQVEMFLVGQLAMAEGDE